MEEKKKEMMNELGWRKDKYDFAIEYLHENPEDIHDAWANPEGHEGKGGELFGFVGPDWKSNDNKVRYEGHIGTCGCLQQIRQAKVNHECDTMLEVCEKNDSMTLSFWPRLWEKIAGDRRLPHESEDIGLEDLPVFADWQMEVDLLRIADGIEVDPLGVYA